MYIIRRKDWDESSYRFKTYGGWATTNEDGTLDLNDVMRFTSNERKLNKLGPNENWVWFGCYKRTDR